MEQYHKNNFHSHTFCEFVAVESLPKIFSTPNYKSKSGSSYFFTEEGVYRSSNHWGRAANCRWRLIAISNAKMQLIDKKLKASKTPVLMWIYD